MSAWIVSKGHIDALVGAMARRELLNVSPDQAGQTLWEENHRSIRSRYSHIPEEAGRQAPTYHYRRPPVEWSPEELMCILGCYDYQTCETDDYETTNAGLMIRELQAALEREGASRGEYPDDVPWGLPECGGRHNAWSSEAEDCADCLALDEAELHSVKEGS